MCEMLVWLSVFFYVAAVETATKKYDIESEAMKLYGDNLKSILARFRRSPDYVEYLKFHLVQMSKERDETAHYLLNIYHRKLMDEIDQMFGVNNTRNLWPNLEESNKLKKMALRANEDSPKNFEEAMRKLDSYHLLHSVLTVDERNNFRDLGFQKAGELIHALIKSLAPEVKGYESTRQPWGESNTGTVTSTTEEHSHMVTRNSSVVTIYANALNSTGTKMPLRHARMRNI